MLVIAPSAANAGPNLSNGCKATTTGAAEMGHYPAWPASQSYMRVACIFSHASVPPGDFVSSNFTIHDFSNVIYHNGASRTITNVAAIAGNSTTFTAADCTGLMGAAPATWVNRAITKIGTGTGNVKANTFAKSFAPLVLPQCTVTLSKATGAGSIAAGTTFKVEDSDIRAVDDATVDLVPPAAANVTSTQANFQASDLGCSVSGTNFVDGTVVSAVVSATQINTNPAPVPTTSAPLPAALQTVTICGTKEVSTSRKVLDATTNAAFNQLISPSARFTALSGVNPASTADVGLRVSGPGITQPCYIVSRVNGTTVNLSSACASGVPLVITPPPPPPAPNPEDVTIGEPSATAPLDGDPVLNQAVQLPLDPGLVKGSQACEQDEMAGFGIAGTWRNPNNFVPPDGLFLSPQPNNMKTVGQILFSTSVVSFAAYIVEVPAATDPLVGVAHYNVVFPGTPTTLALCASTATSPGLGFSIGLVGVTVGQSALPTGTGRPGTAQLRSTRASTTGSNSTIFITDDLGGAGVKWTGSEFNRLCPVPAGKPDINPPNGFICGDG